MYVCMYVYMYIYTFMYVYNTYAHDARSKCWRQSWIDSRSLFLPSRSLSMPSRSLLTCSHDRGGCWWWSGTTTEFRF